MTELDVDMLILQALAEAAAKPVANPAMPASGQRERFVVTFDWGDRATAGMVDALRTAGWNTSENARLPRTTLVVTTRKGVADSRVQKVVAATLMDNGSAMVVRLGGDYIHFWPEAPWRGDTAKKWKSVGA